MHTIEKPAPRFLALTLAVALGGSYFESVQAQTYTSPIPPGQSAEYDMSAAAREMAERSRTLQAALAAEYGRLPEGQAIVADARALADTVEAISRSLDYRPDRNSARAAYREIDGLWHQLERSLAFGGDSPRVDRALRRTAEADAWMHRTLGLAGPRPIETGPIGGGFDPIAPPPPRPRPPLNVVSRPAMRPAFHAAAAAALPHAEQLMIESDAFLVRFQAASFKVPEREGFFADVSRLHDEAAALAQDLRGGAPPEVLAARVEGLNLGWVVLEQRLNRVGRGRPGPNIAALLDLGTTVGRIAGTLEPIIAPVPATPLPAPVPYRPGSIFPR